MNRGWDDAGLETPRSCGVMLSALSHRWTPVCAHLDRSSESQFGAPSLPPSSADSSKIPFASRKTTKHANSHLPHRCQPVVSFIKDLPGKRIWHIFMNSKAPLGKRDIPIEPSKRKSSEPSSGRLPHRSMKVSTWWKDHERGGTTVVNTVCPEEKKEDRVQFRKPYFILFLGLFFLVLTGQESCTVDQDEDGWTVEDGDCDDSDPDIHPGAVEQCDTIDNDCDGEIDEDATNTYYEDLDSDGYCGTAYQSCAETVPAGSCETSTDCDDNNDSVYPGATEVCNGADDDCDNETDEGVTSTVYPDADGDGYGDAAAGSESACIDAEHATNNEDCDDTDASIHPDATEFPDNGLDDDCDGAIDEDILSIAAGGYHSLALTTSGEVWAWGANDYGQLGDGTTTDRYTPVLVEGVSDVVAIASGWIHSLALTTNGEVWAWGANTSGQLGDGTTTDRYSPVLVENLSNVTTIAAGAHHNLALTTSGEVWAWGYNEFGQLGDGTTTDRYTPVLVNDLYDVTAISAGWEHSLALNTSGKAWAWGDNSFGQLGDGTTTDSRNPIQIEDLSEVTAVAAGYGHTLALTVNEIAWAWGYNEFGQLGDGTTTNRYTPVLVDGPGGTMAIAAGYGHSLALITSGEVLAWGVNWNGQLGDGTTTSRSTPVYVSKLTDITIISGGNGHNMALTTNGEVWTWGWNAYGQLGDGTTTDQYTPIQVQGPWN